MIRKIILCILIIPLTACSQAPSLSFLGAYFPAWLVCIIVGIIATLAVHNYLARHNLLTQLIFLPLVYLSLTILFSLLFWLVVFQH